MAFTSFCRKLFRKHSASGNTANVLDLIGHGGHDYKMSWRPDKNLMALTVAAVALYASGGCFISTFVQVHGWLRRRRPRRRRRSSQRPRCPSPIFWDGISMHFQQHFDHGIFFANELGCLEGGSQGTSRQGWLGDLLIAWLPCVPWAPRFQTENGKGKLLGNGGKLNLCDWCLKGFTFLEILFLMFLFF